MAKIKADYFFRYTAAMYKRRTRRSINIIGMFDDRNE